MNRIEDLKHRVATQAIDNYELHINKLFEKWYYDEVRELEQQLSFKDLLKAAYRNGRVVGLTERLNNET